MVNRLSFSGLLALCIFMHGILWVLEMEERKKMNRLQKLQIARMAYRDIRSAIDKWQCDEDPLIYINIYSHWDGCITVDDELFQERELRINDE
jgi:hypothetical protein